MIRQNTGESDYRSMLRRQTDPAIVLRGPAVPNLREFADCRGTVVVGRVCRPPQLAPYLRYAVSETLHAEWLRRSVPGWPSLASSAAVRLVARPNAPMACTITPGRAAPGFAWVARGGPAVRRQRRFAGAGSDRRRRVARDQRP